MRRLPDGSRLLAPAAVDAMTAHDVVGIILTTDAFSSAFPLPAVIHDFSNDVSVALD